MTKRILVTGASGMVGSYAPGVFKDYELILTDCIDSPHALDVREPVRVREMIGDARPDVVLHLAAATDVDRCEQEPDWAYHSNAVGTENVVYSCREFDTTQVCFGAIKRILISSSTPPDQPTFTAIQSWRVSVLSPVHSESITSCVRVGWSEAEPKTRNLWARLQG